MRRRNVDLGILRDEAGQSCMAIYHLFVGNLEPSKKAVFVIHEENQHLAQSALGMGDTDVYMPSGISAGKYLLLAP